MSESPSPPEFAPESGDEHLEEQTRPYHIGMSPAALMDWAASPQEARATLPDMGNASDLQAAIAEAALVASAHAAAASAQPPATETTMANEFEPLPGAGPVRPGAPPAPPRRGAPAPLPLDLESEEPTNPFGVDVPPPSRRSAPINDLPSATGAGAAPPVPPSSSSNPFAAESGANPFLGSAAGYAPAAPAAVPAHGPASVARPPASRPLIEREVIERSPDLRDAHAAFRKGSLLQPILVALLAVGVVVAIVFLAPSGESDKANPAAAQKAAESAVIGRSLPPYRTTLEEESAEDHREAFRKTEQRARDGEEQPARPADVPSERDFKDAFKKAAK